jgi:hypothetical protein
MTQTTASTPAPSRRILAPEERIAEVLFGLIMVLTFTGSLSIAEAGRDDVRAMLIGALGCNIAWGVIDAILYLMTTIADRARGLRTLRAVRSAPNASAAEAHILQALPEPLAAVIQPGELASLHERLTKLPEPPRVARLSAGDWKGALGVFLLVFITTFPVAIPFMVLHEAGPAMRASNIIAVSMLFVLGFALGRVTGRNPWLAAIGMVILGAILVAGTIALGG